MTGVGGQIRKEQAAAKRKKTMQHAKFQIEGNDIVFLDGQYGGQYASQVFASGPEGRDYVSRHIWFTNDETAMNIVRGWLCQ
jgi:hypothetical protein